MLRDLTVSSLPSSEIAPVTTSVAPRSRPTLIIVASLSTADGGSCNRSNALSRSSRVIASTPSLARSSETSTDEPSTSQ
jgi:hypothetical protein